MIYNDRIPPQDLIAERSIISGMVQSEVVYYKAIEQLKEEHFYHSSHKKAFSFLLKNNASKNIYVLEKALDGTPDLTIEDFLSTSYTTSGEEEIKSIIEAYKKRETIISCRNAVEAVFSDPDSRANDIISGVISRISEIATGQNRDTVRIGSMLSAEFERIERIQTGGKNAFISTGMSSLDRSVSIAQHDVVVIGARPSNGKSTFASCIARNICFNGGRVLSFNLDTSNQKEVSRALFSTAGLNLHQFNTWGLPKRDLPKLALGAGPLSETELYLNDTRKLTPSIAEAVCKRLIHEAGPLDLVIFDFLQNMRPNYRVNDIRERISHISEELHDLPKEINCPIFLLSQLARYQNEHKEPPNLNNLKESGDIEEDADIVLLLYYPFHYHWQREKHPEKENLIELFVSKYKDGPTGYVPLNYLPEQMKITAREKNRDNEGDWYHDY